MGEYADMSMDTDWDDFIDMMYRYREMRRLRAERWHNNIKPGVRYMLFAILTGVR